MYGLRNTRCDPLDCLRVEFTVSCERLCSRRVTQRSRRQLSRHLNTTAASPPPSALPWSCWASHATSSTHHFYVCPPPTAATTATRTTTTATTRAEGKRRCRSAALSLSQSLVASCHSLTIFASLLSRAVCYNNGSSCARSPTPTHTLAHSHTRTEWAMRTKRGCLSFRFLMSVSLSRALVFSVLHLASFCFLFCTSCTQARTPMHTDAMRLRACKRRLGLYIKHGRVCCS